MEDSKHLDRFVNDPVADAIRKSPEHKPSGVAIILGVTERKGEDLLSCLIDRFQESAHEAIVVLLCIKCGCFGDIVERKRTEMDF